MTAWRELLGKRPVAIGAVRVMVHNFAMSSSDPFFRVQRSTSIEVESAKAAVEEIREFEERMEQRADASRML